jgi:hypothetical protein
VTVHRDKFPYNKINQFHQFLKFILEMKLYLFRTVPLYIIRSYSLYTQQWYMSNRFVDSFRAAGSGWNSVSSSGFRAAGSGLNSVSSSIFRAAGSGWSSALVYVLAGSGWNSAVVYVTQFCRQLSRSRVRMEFCFEQQLSSSRITMEVHPDPAARKLSTNLYDIYHC